MQRTGESLEMIQTCSNRLEKALHDKSKSYVFGDPKNVGPEFGISYEKQNME